MVVFNCVSWAEITLIRLEVFDAHVIKLGPIVWRRAMYLYMY